MNENNTSNYNIDNTNNKKQIKNSNNKTITMVIITIIIILLLASVSTYLINLKTPQNAFKTLINSGFEYLEDNIQDYESISGNFSLKVSGTSDDNSSNEILKILNKIDVSATYGIDYKNKIMNMDIYTKYNDKQLLNAKIYGENSKSYIYLEDLYDKYIEAEIDDYDSLFEEKNNKEDIKVVLKSIKKALNNSLKDKYFTTETTTINNKKVEKMTLVLNKENCDNIKKDFINYLLNDDKFIESIARISEESPEDIKDLLNESLNQELEEDFEVGEVSIYIDKIDFVGFELRDSKNSLTVTKNSNNYDYIIISNDAEYSGTITLVQEGDNTKITISLSDKDNKNSFEIIMTTSTKYNDIIPKVDVSNSINADEITDDEMLNIYYKIMERESFTELYNDISDYSEITNYRDNI